jgi:predicted nucleotidyltransferase component of viral defense system
MNNLYAQTVRLLLRVAPDVFANDIFAMKGGTAINLFVQDMPRLSVDIDVVYVPWQTPREEALQAITDELDAIAKRLEKLDLRSRKIASKGMGDTKLIVEDDENQVKIEVNIVFRGTVLPVEKRMLCAKTAEMFSAELELPTLTPDELYGSKLVAAMDRQHPRDLFDVWNLYQSSGISDETIECFVTYLAGHNRPTHEVLFGNNKDIAHEYRSSFIGMTIGEPVTLHTLLETRERLRTELRQRLTDKHRQFLVGLAHARPNWDLLKCPHAKELSALRWKLTNIQIFSKSRPADFLKQARELESRLS